MKFDLSH